jgi:hypothetical protein
VFNDNFSNISAISWRYPSLKTTLKTRALPDIEYNSQGLVVSE